MVVRLIWRDTPLSVEILFSWEVDCITMLVTIIFGICLNGRPFDVHHTISLVVRIDLSASGMCAFLGTTFRWIIINMVLAHLNSLSATTYIAWNPRDVYMYMLRCRTFIMVAFVQVLISPTVQKMSYLEMVCRKGMPWTKKKSAHKVTSWWWSLMVCGRCVCIRLMMAGSVWRVLFPWR